MMEMRRVLDIEYRLLPGSDRKTTDIVIERDGAICVRAPPPRPHRSVLERGRQGAARLSGAQRVATDSRRGA